MGTKKRIPQDALPLVDEWEQSGMSKKQFCQERNIAPSTFYYWCKKKSEVNDFMPVKIKEEAVESSSTEVVFPTGARVIFHKGVTASFLKSLLS